MFERAKHIADYESIKAQHAQLAALHTVAYTNPIAVPVNAVPQIPIHQEVCNHQNSEFGRLIIFPFLASTTCY